MIDLTQFQFNLELKIKQYFTGSSGDFQITNGQNNFIVLVLEGENFTPINSSDIPQNFANDKLIYKTYFISKVSGIYSISLEPLVHLRERFGDLCPRNIRIDVLSSSDQNTSVLEDIGGFSMDKINTDNNAFIAFKVQ